MRGDVDEQPEAILSALLASSDPRRSPFSSQVAARGIVSPTGNLMLTDQQFSALRDAAAAVGDERALVAPVEGWDAASSAALEFGLHEIDLADLSSYRDPGPDAVYDSLENAVFSPKGRWIVLLASDDFALIGGDSRFLDVFRERAEPEHGWDDDWLNYWVEEAKAGRDVAWVRPLLEHVHGEADANALLEKHLTPAQRSLL